MKNITVSQKKQVEIATNSDNLSTCNPLKITNPYHYFLEVINNQIEKHGLESRSQITLSKIVGVTRKTMVAYFNRLSEDPRYTIERCKFFPSIIKFKNKFILAILKYVTPLKSLRNKIYNNTPVTGKNILDLKKDNPKKGNVRVFLHFNIAFKDMTLLQKWKWHQRQKEGLSRWHAEMTRLRLKREKDYSRMLYSARNPLQKEKIVESIEQFTDPELKRMMLEFTGFAYGT